MRLADYDSQRQLLDHFVKSLTKPQIKKAVRKLAHSIRTMRDVDDFNYQSHMGEYEDEVFEWLQNNPIYDETTEAMMADLDEVESKDLEDYENTLIELEKEYDFDFNAVYDRYQDLLRDARTPSDYDGDFGSYRPSKPYIPESLANEDRSIDEMFDSLRQS